MQPRLDVPICKMRVELDILGTQFLCLEDFHKVGSLVIVVAGLILRCLTVADIYIY